MMTPYDPKSLLQTRSCKQPQNTAKTTSTMAPSLIHKETVMVRLILGQRLGR